MDNIKTKKVEKPVYYTTDDPNIVIETTTISQEIHLDKLKANIAQLEQELASSQPIELPEELLSQLNQTMTTTLNDGGQTFKKISDIVYAQNGQAGGHVHAELDRLNALLVEVTT